MKNSTMLLALMNGQLSLLMNKGQQIERLQAELNRIERTKPQYSLAVPVNTGIKLMSIGEGIGLTIATMLELAMNKTRENEAAGRLEAQRDELVTVNAAIYMQNLVNALVNRGNENLATAHVLILGADPANCQIAYIPTTASIASQLQTLRTLTLSYAQDLLDQERTVNTYDIPSSSDCFEVRTQKETLQMLMAFAKQQMEKAVALVDIAINSMPSSISTNTVEADILNKVAAFGIASSTMAKFIVDLINDAIAGIGTVTVVSRRTSDFTPEEIYRGLVTLTGHQFNPQLN